MEMWPSMALSGLLTSASLGSRVANPLRRSVHLPTVAMHLSPRYTSGGHCADAHLRQARGVV
eukprot:1692340-Pleurochrysis_carterae.AAC.3